MTPVIARFHYTYAYVQGSWSVVILVKYLQDIRRTDSLRVLNIDTNVKSIRIRLG